MFNKSVLIIFTLLLTAAWLRLIPHPPNFAPIGAMALFAGATLADKRLAFILPLLALLLSDIVLGFHDTMFAVYGAFTGIIALGMFLRGRLQWGRVAGFTVSASLLFFAVSNFGVWLTDPAYPLNTAGLIACYTAAIPFFHYTLLGDAFFASLLFGGYALLHKRAGGAAV